MKNIFTYIPKEQLESKNFHSIENIIYKYIPLKDIDSYSEIKVFRKSLFSNLSTIEQIADITINLCSDYLTYEFPTVGPQFMVNMYNNHKPLPLPIIEKFHNEIYETSSYHSELKYILFLSYCYTQSCGVKETDLAKLLAEKKYFHIYDKSSKDCNQSKEDPKFIYDKVYLLNKNEGPQNLNSVFLYPFFEYAGNNGHIKLNSSFDSEVFLGLIQSNSKRKNPFMFSKRFSKLDSPIKTNLEKFLGCFRDINIQENSRMDSLSALPDDCKKTPYFQITKNMTYIYNQYLLERLTNINFINRIYQLHNRYNIPIYNLEFLMDLVNSPLLKFRLNVIDFFEKNYISEFKQNTISLEQWYLYVKNMLHHQLVCVLPILTLVFHYLMYLYLKDKNNKSGFENAINNYFLQLNSSDSFYFFDYNKKNEFVPIPHIYPFPSNMYNDSYATLSDNVYERLINQTHRLSESENFLSRLKAIHNAQAEFFKEKLLNLDNLYFT